MSSIHMYWHVMSSVCCFYSGIITLHCKALACLKNSCIALCMQLLQGRPFRIMVFLPSLPSTWSWLLHREECLPSALQAGHRYVCEVCVSMSVCVRSDLSFDLLILFWKWCCLTSINLTDALTDRDHECQWNCQWCAVGSGGHHCGMPFCWFLGSLSNWKYDC